MCQESLAAVVLWKRINSRSDSLGRHLRLQAWRELTRCSWIEEKRREAFISPTLMKFAYLQQQWSAKEGKLYEWKRNKQNKIFIEQERKKKQDSCIIWTVGLFYNLCTSYWHNEVFYCFTFSIAVKGNWLRRWFLLNAVCAYVCMHVCMYVASVYMCICMYICS